MNFTETAIGQLIGMGLTDNQLAEICGVSPSAANKWRNGANTAGTSRQLRARGYIEGRLQADKPTPTPHMLPAPEAPTVTNIASSKTMLVDVPAAHEAKFKKMMSLIDLEWLDLDA